MGLSSRQIIPMHGGNITEICARESFSLCFRAPTSDDFGQVVRWPLVIKTLSAIFVTNAVFRFHIECHGIGSQHNALCGCTRA